MRAYFGSVGLNINFEDKDQDKSKLECTIAAYNFPKLTVERRMQVDNVGNCEEPGVHLETIPCKDSFETCKEILIYLDDNVWNKIFLGYDPESRCGGFMTRHGRARIDLAYFSPEKHNKLF